MTLKRPWNHVMLIFISFYDMVQISLESTNLRPRPAAQSPPVPSKHPQGPEKMPPAPAATSAAAHHDRPPWRHRTGQTVAAPPSVPWPSSGYATYKTEALDNQPKNRYITCYQHTNLHTMIDLCTFYDIVYVCLPVSVCVRFINYICMHVYLCECPYKIMFVLTVGSFIELYCKNWSYPTEMGVA